MGNIITNDGVDFESDFIISASDTSPKLWLKGKRIGNSTTSTQITIEDGINNSSVNTDSHIQYQLNNKGYCARILRDNPNYKILIEYYDRWKAHNSEYMFYESNMTVNATYKRSTYDDRLVTYDPSKTNGQASYTVYDQKTYLGTLTTTYNGFAVHHFIITIFLKDNYQYMDNFVVNQGYYDDLYIGSYLYKYKKADTHMYTKIDGVFTKMPLSFKVKDGNANKTLQGIWVKTDNSWKEIASQQYVSFIRQ